MVKYNKLFLLVAMMITSVSSSSVAFPEFKEQAKRADFIVEPRTLAILGSVGLTVSAVSAYLSMKNGFVIENYEKQKEAVAGHEELLHLVRKKIINLLKVNPENKVDFEELSAEEAVLLEEIKEIKDKEIKWSLKEIVTSQAFKHLSSKDLIRGLGTVLVPILVAEVGFKGSELFLRAQGNDAEADSLWKECYEAQEESYAEIAACAKVLYDIGKKIRPLALEVIASLLPDKKEVGLGLLSATGYSLKCARDSMRTRKSEQAEKFSYLDDMLLSPLKVIKEIGLLGSVQWAGLSFAGAHFFSKFFELAELRAKIKKEAEGAKP